MYYILEFWYYDCTNTRRKARIRCKDIRKTPYGIWVTCQNIYGGEERHFHQNEDIISLMEEPNNYQYSEGGN